MNAKQRLIQELEQTPDFLIEEVLNFLLFLKNRLFQKFQTPAKTQQETPFTGQSLLEWTDSIAAEIPPEAWDNVPSDLAQNLDHYLYGSPKEEVCEPSSLTPATGLPASIPKMNSINESEQLQQS